MSAVLHFPQWRPRRETEPSPCRRLSAPDPAAIAPTPLWGTCPWSAEFTDYDRRNISLYAWLLHDESEGASEEDLARVVFRLDPSRKRVRDVVRSHLRRAHWIADTLLPMLGW